MTKSAFISGSDAVRAAVPEPPPTGDGPEILPLVIADLKARAAMGREKYGTTLRAHNGRNALVDAYQEALDLAMYLRQELEEETGGADLQREYDVLVRQADIQEFLADIKNGRATNSPECIRDSPAMTPLLFGGYSPQSYIILAIIALVADVELLKMRTNV